MDGKYLATAGQDPVVTIWSVRSKMSRPLADNEIAEESGRELFENRPFRTFVGHQSTICDLAWSKVFTSPPLYDDMQDDLKKNER